MNRPLLSALSLAALLGMSSISISAHAESAGKAPAALERIGYDQRVGGQIPLDLSFRDEAGSEVRLGQYFGHRPVVMVLAYYGCPMLCTATLNGLAGAMKAIETAVTKSETAHRGEIRFAAEAALDGGFGFRCQPKPFTSMLRAPSFAITFGHLARSSMASFQSAKTSSALPA